MSYNPTQRNILTIIIKRILRSFLMDSLLAIIYAAAVLVGRIIMKIGIQFLPISRVVGDKMGGHFVQMHYYTPLPEKNIRSTKKLNIGYNTPDMQFDILRKRIGRENILLNEAELAIRENFKTEYAEEFNIENTTFHTYDAAIYYYFLISQKPIKILEIGSGNSTKIAIAYKNEMKKKGVEVDITCIEPYEVKWLENANVKLIRSKVENIDNNFDYANYDLLFIDSSHVVKIGGDLEKIYCEVIPLLKKGAIVHIHDIFSPNIFPEDWRYKNMRLWGEQVLVDALVAGETLQHLFTIDCLVTEYPNEFKYNRKYQNSSSYFVKNNK